MSPSFDREAALQEIVSVLAELFNVEPDEIVQDTRLAEDLDLDSIDAIDMLTRLREMTGTRPDPEVLEEIKTVGDVVDLVERLSN